MSAYWEHEEDGYRAGIALGMEGLPAIGALTRGEGTQEERLLRLKRALSEAEAVAVGAGAGLSASAGLSYSGERFEKYFFDFARRFGIRDMYSGGFYPFPDAGTRWAWWARHIYFNRYVEPPRPVYRQLLSLLGDREYFVLTTNVDHQFQRAGIDRQRLFYTQGDYGLFQSRDPKEGKTCDNEAWVRRAMEAQGFSRGEDGQFFLPPGVRPLMRLPDELIPRDRQGREMVMNLRSDDSFLEDEGWRAASARYAAFLRRHERDRVLYLELGVGGNTPVIIKYPFWEMTRRNGRAAYACVNFSADEAVCPAAIAGRSVCVAGDIGEVLARCAEG